MPDIRKKIGERIRSIRKSRKLTQEALAELIGIETPSMSNLETGKTSPSYDTLQKLSEVLKAEVWEFYYFGGEGGSTSQQEMLGFITKILGASPELTKIIYKFCRSWERDFD